MGKCNLRHINFQINKYRNNFQRQKYKPIYNTSVKEALEKLHYGFVVVPIDKTANNVFFMLKTLYVTTLLKELGVIDLIKRIN